MKNVLVTLLAEKPCELSRFLKSYYRRNIIIDETAFKWSVFCNSPAETISIISTLMDNDDAFKITAFLTLEKAATIKVTNENIEELIRLFLLQAN